MLKIGTFARLAGTTVKALRFYEGQGLLRPAHVDVATGYRYFDVRQVEDVALVKRLRSVGFSVREIHAIRGKPAHEARLREALAARQKAISAERDRAWHQLRDIRVWIERLDTAGGELPICGLRAEAPMNVASLRRQVGSYGDSEGLFDELGTSIERGRRPQALSAIWHTCGDGGELAECEVFSSVADRACVRAPAQVTRRPAEWLATLLHHGPTTTAPRPYDVLREWTATQGLRIVGPKREVYWKGTPAMERPSDITEIQFPVEPARRTP